MLHVQARENRCHDADHTFATFVHHGILQSSPLFRYQNYSNMVRAIVSHFEV